MKLSLFNYVSTQKNTQHIFKSIFLDFDYTLLCGLCTRVEAHRLQYALCTLQCLEDSCLGCTPSRATHDSAQLATKLSSCKSTKSAKLQSWHLVEGCRMHFIVKKELGWGEMKRA